MSDTDPLGILPKHVFMVRFGGVRITPLTKTPCGSSALHLVRS